MLASDFSANPGYGNQPGYTSYLELEHYGSIEMEKIANLLLLSANALASVSAYRRIERVILHGQIIDRDSLAADYPRPAR